MTTLQKIEERIKEYKKIIDEESLDSIDLKIGERNACNHILKNLDTMQEEEVDLEKEMDDWRHNHFHGRRDKSAAGEYLERTTQLDIARHFYNIGKQSSDSLQEKDVDLEKEIKETCRGYRITDSYESSLGKNDIRNIATRFYNLGKQSSDNPKIKGWVARDKDGQLCIFYGDEPHRGGCDRWWSQEHCPLGDWMNIPENLFLNLKWEDEPIEVELTIKKI